MTGLLALWGALVFGTPASPSAPELVAPGLSSTVAERALQVWRVAQVRSLIARPRLSIVDYDLPSTSKRLWVFDMRVPSTPRLLFTELVAHGKGSGDNLATVFSDTGGSYASSLGVFRVAERYTGKHGVSVKLDGLEPGWNSKARHRAVVIHGARYVSEAFARKHGRLGRSWGCPAVREDVVDALVDAIAGGSLLVVHRSDRRWLDGSTFLR